MSKSFRLAVSGSSFTYLMPRDVLAASYGNTAVGPVRFDDRLNRLMTDFVRLMMRAMNSSEIAAMECYHTTAWNKEPILEVMLTDPQVEFWSVHAPYGRYFDPSSPDQEIRERASAAFVDSIDVAARLGAKVIVAHPGANAEYPEPKQVRMGFVAEIIRRVADIAGERDIKIAVEPMPRKEIGNSLDAVLEIIEIIDRPNVGVNFDVNHLYPPEQIPSLIRKAGSLILNAHISDQDGEERHWLPFEGILDWREVLSAFVDAGYRGPLVYETHIKGAANCEEAAERIAENYKRLIELLPVALQR